MRHLVKTNIVLIVQYIVASVVPILLVPSIVKSIGLENWGNISLLIYIGNYGAMVVSYTFNLTGPKMIATAIKGRVESIYMDIMASKAILLCVTLFFLFLIHHFYIYSADFFYSALIILFIIPVSAFLNSAWLCQYFNKFGQTSLIGMLASSSVAGIGLLAIGLGCDNIEFFSFVLVLNPIILGVGTLLLAKRVLKFKFKCFSIDRAFFVIKDGLHLFFSQIISLAAVAAAPLIINSILGSEETGAYALMERVINALMTACMLTYTAAYPLLARTYISDAIQYRKVLYITVGIYIFGSTAILLFFEYNFYYLISYFYGHYDDGLYYLFLSGILWLFVGIFGPLLTAHYTFAGCADRIIRLNLLVTVVSITAATISTYYFKSPSAWFFSLSFCQLINLYYFIVCCVIKVNR